MGIFNIFTTPQEKKKKDLLENKPRTLMHTSTSDPQRTHSFAPSFYKKLNRMIVFATDDERIAKLYTLQPFYSFNFGNNEIGAIITGETHSLLKIDDRKAYIYYLDPTNFEPIVSEQGHFNNEWVSNNEEHIRSDIPPKKVTFDDILRMGVQVFWIKDFETLSNIDKQMRVENVISGNQKLEFLINQTNWKPDKVMYMNAYRKICPASQTEQGWIVNKIDNPVVNTSIIENAINTNQNMPNISNQQNTNQVPNNTTTYQQAVSNQQMNRGYYNNQYYTNNRRGRKI